MILFIVNPIAGTDFAVKTAAEIKTVLEERGVEYRIVETTCPGDATQIASRAAADPSCDIVCAVGGDGTLLEVACGLVGTGKPMGIIPAGTGNDFIKTVHIPKDPHEALDFLLTHEARPVDMGMINDSSFLNVCGTGFDVATLDEAEAAKKYCRGMLPYLIGLIKAIVHHRPTHLRLEIDGVQTEEDVLICSIANGRYIGGGIPICPVSDPNDGKLDAVIVKSVPRRRIPGYLPALLKGKLLEHTEICRHVHCDSLTMVCPGMRVNVDGEIFSMDQATFGIRPQALMLIW